MSKTIAELQAMVTKLEDQLKQTIKRQIVTQLKIDYGTSGLGDDYFANRIEVVPEAEGSSKFVPRVVLNGEIVYKAGLFMTPDQLVKEAKSNKDLSGLFVAGSRSGVGAPSGQGAHVEDGAKTMSRAQFDGLNQTEKHKFMVADKGQIVG